MRFLRTGPAGSSLLIGVVVFVLAAVTWQWGLLQRAELAVYDSFVAAHANPKAVDPRIVIVQQTEDDIDHLDFPLRDEVLSELLEKIESGGPVVIGVDLYRDLPEPRDGSGLSVLNKTLLAHDNIIAIFKGGDEKQSFAIEPPPGLLSTPSRYGFNDFPTDYDGNVRRYFLYAPFGGQSYNSLAWLVAQYYLSGRGIVPAYANHRLRFSKTIIPRFSSNEGGYVGAPSAGYQFLLDFRGPQNFVSLSVRDVLALKDASRFKDKIVFIGSSAVSLGDSYQTPVSQASVLGLLIQAQALNQLLRIALDGDRPVESASLIFMWFYLAVCCAIGILNGLLVRSHLLFAATSIAACAAIFAGSWLLFLSGYWTITVVPLVGFMGSCILVKSYVASYEEAQRAALMKLFAQRVSPKVAEKIWQERHLFLEGGRPVARQLTVTALFTDLKDYSTISEKMAPVELIAWVNECHAALAQHVTKNGGFISTYMGDGMMAVFGVPVPRLTEAEKQQDAIAAVRCALAMAGEIKTMNDRWKTEGRPLAGLRVGIFTGEAMTGELGPEDHLEYSVIGDTVNTASRLESVDKEGELTGVSECRILIGSRTYEYIKDTIQSRFIGKISLKGKQETTDVYKVLDGAYDNPEHSIDAHENRASNL